MDFIIRSQLCLLAAWPIYAYKGQIIYLHIHSVHSLYHQECVVLKRNVCELSLTFELCTSASCWAQQPDHLTLYDHAICSHSGSHCAEICSCVWGAGMFVIMCLTEPSAPWLNTTLLTENKKQSTKYVYILSPHKPHVMWEPGLLNI